MVPRSFQFIVNEIDDLSNVKRATSPIRTGVENPSYDCKKAVGPAYRSHICERTMRHSRDLKDGNQGDGIRGDENKAGKLEQNVVANVEQEQSTIDQGIDVVKSKVSPGRKAGW